MPYSKYIGNPFAKKILEKIAESKNFFPVLLFSGPVGVGKKTFAKEFLHDLLGEKNSQINTKWFFPEGKQNIHLISSIKEIIEEAPIAPFTGDKKGYVIAEADRMLPATSNALLKTLEEPPPHAFFLLITAHEEEILQTIRSRAIKIPFYPIEEKEIANFLIKEGKNEKEALQIAIHSKGSLSKARLLAAKAKQSLQEMFLQALSLGLIEPKCFDALEPFWEEEENVVEVMEGFFSAVLFWARDLEYLRVTKDEEGVFYKEYISSLREQSKKEIPSTELLLSLIEEAKEDVMRNIKPKHVLEEFFYRIYLRT